MPARGYESLSGQLDIELNTRKRERSLGISLVFI